MMMPKRKRSGRRLEGHDYAARCIYHIILNKNDGIPPFSRIVGEVGSHDNPPRVERTPLGEIVNGCLSAVRKRYPFASILRRCVMPDHVHFAIFIKEKSDVHLGDIILSLKSDCRQAAMGAGLPYLLFEEGYYDIILTKYDQLPKMLAYISDNPRRLLVRRQYPGWFRRFQIELETGERLDAYGNWDLFADADVEAVRISRRFSPDELRERKCRWLRTIRNGGVLVSPFISRGEMKVRDYAEENECNIIYITDEPFGERYKPQGRRFELCSEGRMAIVSVPSLRVGSKELRREDCLRMNSIAESIASGGCRIIC